LGVIVFLLIKKKGEAQERRERVDILPKLREGIRGGGGVEKKLSFGFKERKRRSHKRGKAHYWAGGGQIERKVLTVRMCGVWRKERWGRDGLVNRPWEDHFFKFRREGEGEKDSMGSKLAVQLLLKNAHKRKHKEDC